MLYDPKWEAPAVIEQPQPELWRQILIAAADLIKTNGWCQGEMHDASGSFCAIGAIAAAEEVVPNASYDDVMMAEGRMRSCVGGSSVTRWNDHLLFFGSYRVRRALRQAAKD